MIRTLAILASIGGISFVARGDDPELHEFERKTPEGAVVESYTYYKQNGKQVKHGRMANYYEGGQLLGTSEYQDGKLHGMVLSYYEKLGTKSEEYHFSEGKRDGVSRKWGPDGKVIFEGEFRQDRPWSGRHSVKGTSSRGITERKETWETFAYEEGKKIWRSKKTFESVLKLAVSDQLPDMRKFRNWNWISYRTDSIYPFKDQLPPFEKVPFVIDWCAKNPDDTNTAHSQLKALTRMDMYGEESETTAWKAWWETVGRKWQGMSDSHGKKDPEAWRLVAGERAIDCPQAPIILPEEFRIVLIFRSGDYHGVMNEALVIQKSAAGSSLTREFSTRTKGPITQETWLPFGVEDAERITRAIAYVIDHPWLRNDERTIAREYKKHVEASNGKSSPAGGLPTKAIVGRESFRLYFASTKFRLEDGKGDVWWNLDPRTWDGENGGHFNWSDSPVLTVYPFVAKQFPEDQRFDDGKRAGWEAID